MRTDMDKGLMIHYSKRQLEPGIETDVVELYRCAERWLFRVVACAAYTLPLYQSFKLMTLSTSLAWASVGPNHQAKTFPSRGRIR